MSEATTIELVHPIVVGKAKDGQDKLLTELSFRQGTLGDLRDSPIEPRVGDLLVIAARMCGQPPSVIGKLQEEDAGRVLKLAIDFFGRCLATGSGG